MSKRHGLLAGGNFIVDRVKVVDHYPQEEMLATILSESLSNGGGPYNLLKDLAAMQCGFPLAAVGLIGADAEGDSILTDCQQAGIDAEQLHQTDQAPTSYTDAMTVTETGRRTFFHQRGTNALLDIEHFDFTSTNAKLFYLGYLNLLDRLDLCERDRSRASLVLQHARDAGLVTCVDMVSVDSPKFQQVARAALPYTDHLLVNETEAGKTLGRSVAADDPNDMQSAAEQLLALGVQQTATIHSRHGAACCGADGQRAFQKAQALLPGQTMQGSNGAGDAFAAGYLAGLHEGLSIPQRLERGAAIATMCLTDPTPSGGIASL